MPKYFNCIVCKKRTGPKDRRNITPSIRRYLRTRLLIEDNSISAAHAICNKCKHRYYIADCKPVAHAVSDTIRGQQTDQDYQPASTSRKPLNSPPSICLPIPGAPATHSRCIVCTRPGPKLIVIPSNTRFWAFIDKNIIIRAGSRCCPVHVSSDGCIAPELLDKVPLSSKSVLNRTSVIQLIQNTRDMCKQQLHSFVSFDNIGDSDCHHLTGLSKTQFDNLCQHIIDKVKSTPCRSPRMSIGLFLLKLKSAISNQLLATLFRISASSVRRAIVAVRQALMRSFVPLYLGMESVTREQIISKHTRPLAKSLFDVENNMILVLDGTYIYIQKSENFSFQRLSFSTHKCRPLVKPMVVVTTTGHFVTIMGPYLARNNDATILNHMLKRNVDDIKSSLHEDDLLIVDRGFRDSLAILEEMGLRAAMPTFLKKGEKQMSVEDANSSRLVTKIRWVVESANARIKRFKYLDRVLPTSQVPFIGDYVRIVCAISNAYFPALTGSNDVEMDTALATHMRHLSTQVNSLKLFVEENKLERKKSVWTPIDECQLECFPALNDEQLRWLTCGVYQLKLSSSYIQEYIDGDAKIHVHKEDHNLLCVKLQSRHITAKQYMLWIRYSETEVTAWYCKCRAGARVVGVCSHIAAVVWYLTSARHNASGKPFGVRDWSQYLADANDLPETIDSSGSIVSGTEE